MCGIFASFKRCFTSISKRTVCYGCMGFKLCNCALFVLFKKKSSSSIFVRPKSIKVSSNLLKSFVLRGELVNEIGRHLSHGHHPSEVKVHTPCCQVNYIINRVPTRSDASAGARVLRMASACGSSSCHLLTSCYLEVRMLCHPPPPHPTAALTHTCSSPSVTE